MELLHNLAKTDETEQVRSDAWEFMLTLADNGDIKPIFESKGILQKLMNDASPNAEPVPLAATLQILGHLAVHDSCMEIMFESFNVFVDLLTHPDTNVKTFTAMILGNIARKGKNIPLLTPIGQLLTLNFVYVVQRCLLLKTCRIRSSSNFTQLVQRRS